MKRPLSDSRSSNNYSSNPPQSAMSTTGNKLKPPKAVNSSSSEVSKFRMPSHLEQRKPAKFSKESTKTSFKPKGRPFLPFLEQTHPPTKRVPFEESEEEDSDLEGFIVDDDEVEEPVGDFRKMLRETTGYDPSKFQDDGDIEEVGYREIVKEEALRYETCLQSITYLIFTILALKLLLKKMLNNFG